MQAMKGKAMQFEDLRVWKITRELTKSIYGVTRASVMFRDYALKDQMRRSAISSMSNIAEGYERDGNRELRQFLSIAKGSIGELRSQLYIALDAGYLVKSEADSLLERSRTISRMLSSLIESITRSGYKGRKLLK
jgi:four helix bundle protein